MTTELTTETTLDITPAQMTSWGGQSNLDTNDFRVSKILLMHPTSVMALDDNHEAKKGEFRDNVNGTLMGGINDPIKFVPFHLEKRWTVESLQEGKWKWNRTDLFDNTNSTRAVSLGKKNFIDVNGERYFIMYRAFILLTTDLDAGIEKPYIVDFRNSSREAGRVLGQRMFQDNRLEKLPPAGYVATLGVEEISNSENKWLAFKVAPTERVSTTKEVMSAFRMSQALSQMDTTHADTPEETESSKYTKEDIPF